MAEITLGNRDASIVLDSRQDEYVRKVIKGATGSALRSLELTVASLATQARAGWPVGKSPTHKRSRDQMVEGIRLVSDGQGPYLGAYIGNDAAWAYYIRSKKVAAYGRNAPVTLTPPLPLDEQVEQPDPKALHAFSELIRKPFKARESELAAELQRETTKTARSA